MICKQLSPTWSQPESLLARPQQAAVAAAIGRVDCDQGVVRLRNNGGYSDYNGVQAEFRANNLFKQVTDSCRLHLHEEFGQRRLKSSRQAPAQTAWLLHKTIRTTTAEH